MRSARRRLDAGASLPIAEALKRGAGWLLAEQKDDGGWCDEHWTGTGFPAVFYLRYHYYDRYFPLQALAAYRRAAELSGSSRT